MLREKELRTYPLHSQLRRLWSVGEKQTNKQRPWKVEVFRNLERRRGRGVEEGDRPVTSATVLLAGETLRWPRVKPWEVMLKKREAVKVRED